MSQKHDPEATAQKLADLLDRNEISIFSEEEVEDLRAMIKLWRAARGAAWLAGGSAAAVKWAAIMIAAWLAFKAGLLDWIREGLSSR